MNTKKTVKSNISLRQLIDVDETNGSVDRYDNIFHGQIMTAYVVKDRPKVFRFQHLSSVVQAGAGIGITETDGKITISNTGVTKLIAGTNVTLSNETGDITINVTAGGGSAVWGGITGTLSSQTDLYSALSAKYDASNPSGYITSSALSPYLTSSSAAATYYPLTNPSGYTSNTGTVTSVTGTSPIVSSGGAAPAISIPQATSLVNGYLTSTDWSTFNSKQDALVSGTTIKTINSTSVLGSGNIAVEPTITAGTTAQYWRGDKSWQTLDKTAVGLGNVDNTSDVNKPISTATQTALNAKGYALVANLNNATITSGTTTYAGFGGNTTFAGNESQRRVPVSAGTVSNLYIRTAGTMTGSCTITVMKNGSATSMAITIAAGSAGGVYTTSSNTFSVADGDEISLRFAQTTATSIGFYALSLIIK